MKREPSLTWQQSSLNRNLFLGIRVDPISRRDVVLWVGDRVSEGSLQNQIVVLNVAKHVQARRDSGLREILERADIVTADGAPIVWLSRFFGKKLPERVTGIDVMYDLLVEGNKRQWSFYFFGATQEVVEQYAAKVRLTYPHVRIAGFRNGYFAKEEERGIVDAINQSGANILFIAFGSPKKERFVESWKSDLCINVIHGVGGSFDVFTGRTKRAPKLIQKIGLEWFYRMLQEPRRMFKRYATTNTIFFRLVIQEIFLRMAAVARVGKRHRSSS